MVEHTRAVRGTLRGKAEPHIGQWLLLPVHRPCHPWRVAVVHQSGEVLPGRWAKLALKGSSLRRVRRVERVCKDPVGPQGLVGERGGAGPSAHLAPSDRKARKARQGTRVGGTQWRTCPPGPQGAAGPAGPPGPAGPKGDTSPPPIYRVVTGTDTVNCMAGEILAGFVCASGATDGAKCVTPGTPATGLCVRQ